MAESGAPMANDTARLHELDWVPLGSESVRLLGMRCNATTISRSHTKRTRRTIAVYDGAVRPVRAINLDLLMCRSRCATHSVSARRRTVLTITPYSSSDDDHQRESYTIAFEWFAQFRVGFKSKCEK